MNERTFIHLSRAWYGPANLPLDRFVDEVMMGFSDRPGEIAMRWYNLSNAIVPHLELFNDSFRALAEMPDLIAALSDADGVDFTPLEFCGMLVELGFRDETPTDEDRRASLEEKMRELSRKEEGQPQTVHP